MRALSDKEFDLIGRIAELLTLEKRVQLLSDAANATVESVVADGSRLIFHIAGYQRPPYDGQHLFSAEGKMLDRDFAQLDVLLFADQNDRLLELEFVRYETGDLVGPQWETLKIQQ